MGNKITFTGYFLYFRYLEKITFAKNRLCVLFPQLFFLQILYQFRKSSNSLFYSYSTNYIKKNDLIILQSR